MYDGDDGGWSSDDDGPLPEPPVDLPDDPDPEDIDALDEVIRSERLSNRGHGDRALWILQLLRETSPCAGLTARQLVAAEIGAALNLGSGAATKLVDIAVMLRDRLPATLRAVCDGTLSWYMASILAEGTAPLTDDQARQVEDKTLAKAAGRTPAQHADAVRRAVAHVDPDGADARRKQARKTVRMVRSHDGDGMGVLFTQMTSEQLDIAWAGCDFWACNRKAQGDPRSLDELRVAALIQCAQSILHHGDPEYCLRWCPPGSHGGPVDTLPDDDDSGDDSGDEDDDEPDDGEDQPDDDEPDDDAPTEGAGTDLEPVADEPHDVEPQEPQPSTGGSDEPEQPPASRPPTRHGRPAALHAIWDLTSLLGLTRHCGELLDSGAMMPPDAMSELVAGGVKIRRMLIDPESGELVDLTPRTCRVARTKRTELDA